jgi:hypothetical protein
MPFVLMLREAEYAMLPRKRVATFKHEVCIKSKQKKPRRMSKLLMKMLSGWQD